MFQTETLDALFGARDSVSGVIIQLSPTDASQAADLHKLLQQRDKLTATIQRVIEAKFKDATAGLADAFAKLDKATAELAKVSKDLQTIAGVIALVDQVVELAVTVMTVAVAI